jgi:hypothetical protein
MDRDQLKAWLDAGLSLPQIGALTNRDPSTVGYWVKKYGLTANGKERYAPRGGLTREQLEPLVERGATIDEIAAELDRNSSTIRYWLKKHGLKPNGRRGRRPRAPREEIAAAIRNGTRTLMASCPRHGMTEFAVVTSTGHLKCKRCRSEAVQRRRRKVQRILVEEAGGRCLLCGYDRSLAALEFHHLDPESKSFGLAHRGITRSIDEVRREAKKCLLVCSNCHAEIEAGVRAVPLELAKAVGSG